MRNHFKMLETGFKLFPETGWEANFRFFGYEHPLAGHSQGYGVSFDQLIANHFNVFGRYGENRPELSEWHTIEKAWSAGLGFKQMLLQREFKIGIAYAETYVKENPLPERMGEIYLNNQLNEWVFVSPHFQWLEVPGDKKKEYFIAGLRLNFTY